MTEDIVTDEVSEAGGIRTFLDGRVVLHCGDVMAVLDAMPECSVDSIVTDPPYDLGFMGKDWDKGGIAMRPEVWAKMLRVLKPGGHLVAFAAPRNQHRMVCAIEDAGFDIRDGLMWLYGTGFPKSHDVSKGIDKAAGIEREVIGRVVYGDGHIQNSTKSIGFGGSDPDVDKRIITAPATDAARQWSGWGTALKPAHEPICLARKPLSEGTVAANVFRWGTGVINIDGCRVETDTLRPWREKTGRTGNIYGAGLEGSRAVEDTTVGRWPANVLHDGSDEVVAAFPDSRGQLARARTDGSPQGNQIYEASRHITKQPEPRGDSGSAARFFWSPKASKRERCGSKHPTVKPIALNRYLCRLVTPPGGVCLDPFAGTGTMAEAAHLEGMRAVLIEREVEYQRDIARRMEGL